MIVPFIESPPENIRVLLVSRFPDVLESDCEALAADKRITVVGCTETLMDALDLVRLQFPDVVLSGAYFGDPEDIDTGAYLARKVRSLPGLPFQPCIAILTTAINYHDLVDFSLKSGADFCLRRDLYPSPKDLTSLTYFLSQTAYRKNGNRITELRGDLTAQKRRWLRAALRIRIRESGIFAEVIDDWDLDKTCFIELLALIIERGGLAYPMEEATIEVAIKFKTTPRRIARKALTYIKKAAAEARRLRPELSPDNPFVMDKCDISIEPVIAYYVRTFS